eukprot:3641410-Amphidinium_carterae.1
MQRKMRLSTAHWIQLRILEVGLETLINFMVYKWQVFFLIERFFIGASLRGMSSNHLLRKGGYLLSECRQLLLQLLILLSK